MTSKQSRDGSPVHTGHSAGQNPRCVLSEIQGVQRPSLAKYDRYGQIHTTLWCASDVNLVTLAKAHEEAKLAQGHQNTHQVHQKAT